MPIAHSRITAQGQISVPSAVRKKLGVGPGSVLEWDERDDAVILRRAGWHTSEEIHAAVFGKAAPPPKSTKELKDGIRKYLRKRHAGS